MQEVAIARELVQIVYLVVKRDHFHAIEWLQLVHKGVGCSLYFFQLVASSRARVEQEYDVKRRCDLSKERDLLWYVVFGNRELFLAQVGDVHAAAVSGDQRHCYQIGVDF